MRRVAFHRDRRQIGPCGLGRHLVEHLAFPPELYLYIVKILVGMLAAIVKQNLYSVKIAAIRSRMARTSRETRTSRPARRRPAKATAERTASPRRRPAGETPYHHG